MLNSYCKNETFSKFLILFFLATSGFPSFLKFKALIPILLPFIITKLARGNKSLSKKGLFFMWFIFFFSIIHFFVGHLTFVGSISFVLYFLTILYSALFIGENFSHIYIKVMTFLSYIAIVIWLTIFLQPSLHDFFVNMASFLPQMMTEEWIENSTNNGVSLYLYYLPLKTSTEYTTFIRNCGPFYEPGLFASYLSIALVLNFCKNHKLFQKNNIILIIAILSTASSAGYISLALIILYSIFYEENKYTKIFMIFLFILLWKPISELDFMSNKIMNNYEGSLETSSSRFGAILYHSEKIIESPFIGFAGGALPTTNFDRFMDTKNLERIVSPNGLSYVFVFWGIPCAILFYIFLYKGIRKYIGIEKSKGEIFFIFIVILSSAFSQTITTEALLLLIALSTFVSTNNKIQNNKIYE